MSRLAAKNSHEKRPFKPQVYKSRGQNMSITREVIRTEVIGQTVETEDSMEIISLDKAIETIIFEGTLEDKEKENIEMIGIMIIIEAGIGQEKGHLQEIMVIIGIGVPVTVGQSQDLELAQIEIG